MPHPKTMLALVQTQGGFADEMPSGAPERLDPYVTLATIPTPTPQKDELLIKVRMAPINPSDVAFVAGVYGQPRVAGAPAGFEGIGDVVSSGGGLLADRLVGKRVSFLGGVSGSWAEYAVAQARTCLPLRSEVSDENGAALLVNPFSAWAMFDIVRKEKAKAFVMTAGASQLCKLLIGLATEKGYRPISLVRRDEHIEPLRRLGAAHVLNTEAPEFVEALKTVLKREKPRVLLDALSGPVATSVFARMGKRSRWILYGGLDLRPATLPDPGQFIFQSKRIEGFWLTAWLQSGSIVRSLNAARSVQGRFASGAWNTDVAAVVSLSDTVEAVPEFLRNANRGKVMITP